MKAEQMFEEYLPLIEKSLKDYLPSKNADHAAVLYEAMRYGVLNGGKRIRPVLLLEFCRICGGNIMDALPFACAVEMIHSYSLVHDDLPCMDNDALRRGKPSAHKAFGEDMALLAGDALLTKAFEVMLCPESLRLVSPSAAAQAAGILAKEAGCDGMVGGQVIDLQSENKHISQELLEEMDGKKTIALIRAACLMGCTIGRGTPEDLKAAASFAEGIGLTFQVVDDILDIVGDTQMLGKTVGSDCENQKSTYVSLLGIEKATEEAHRLTAEACSALAPFGERGKRLQALAYMLLERKR